MTDPTTDDLRAAAERLIKAGRPGQPMRRRLLWAADRITELEAELQKQRLDAITAFGEYQESFDRIDELEEFLDWLAENQASPACEYGYGARDEWGCITWVYDADYVPVPEKYLALAQRWRMKR